MTTPLLQYQAARRLPPNPRALLRISIWITSIAIAIGIAQNLLNNAIAPELNFHFIGWQWVPIRWMAHVNMNLVDGVFGGLLMSSIFTAATAAMTGRACELRTALRWFALILAADIAIWIVGGAIAASLAAVHWTLYSFLISQPLATRVRLAWVYGAVLGYEFAGPVLLTLILMRFNKWWKSL